MKYVGIDLGTTNSAICTYDGDSVRLYNYKKKQTLKTEVLYWQQKDSMIFTPKRVYIFSPKGKFMGEGLKTKQDFSRYEILKPQGNVVIEKEEEL